MHPLAAGDRLERYSVPSTITFGHLVVFGTALEQHLFETLTTFDCCNWPLGLCIDPGQICSLFTSCSNHLVHMASLVTSSELDMLWRTLSFW